MNGGGAVSRFLWIDGIGIQAKLPQVNDSVASALVGDPQNARFLSMPLDRSIELKVANQKFTPEKKQPTQYSV